MEPITGLHSKGRLPALPANIGLEWKRRKVGNTLAYYVRNFYNALQVWGLWYLTLQIHYLWEINRLRSNIVNL